MYPPKHHTETDINKIYQLIEAYPFATIISNTGDDILITRLPLMLDKTRGKHGILIGHLSVLNPQSKFLDNKKITVLFHGPDCYISPTTYSTPQLPTWNYITVEAKGHSKAITDNSAVLKTIEDMTKYLETGTEPYILNLDNKKIQTLIEYVIGFEIDIEKIIGLFKLSQDKSKQDTLLAKEKLIKRSSHSHADLINTLLEK